MKAQKVLIVLGLMLASIGLVSCARQTGGKVVAPEIPIVQHKMAFPSPVVLDAKLGEFRDARAGLDAEAEQGNTTVPVGDIGSVVAKAVAAALDRQGFALSEGAARRLSGSVMEWKASVGNGSFPTLSSEAELRAEVFDASGKRVYTGTYHGKRESAFPVISESDIRESLSISMAEAVMRMAEDRSLTEALRN